MCEELLTSSGASYPLLLAPGCLVFLAPRPLAAIRPASEGQRFIAPRQDPPRSPCAYASPTITPYYSQAAVIS